MPGDAQPLRPRLDDDFQLGAFATSLRPAASSCPDVKKRLFSPACGWTKPKPLAELNHTTSASTASAFALMLDDRDWGRRLKKLGSWKLRRAVGRPTRLPAAYPFRSISILANVVLRGLPLAVSFD